MTDVVCLDIASCTKPWSFLGSRPIARHLADRFSLVRGIAEHGVHYAVNAGQVDKVREIIGAPDDRIHVVSGNVNLFTSIAEAFPGVGRLLVVAARTPLLSERTLERATEFRRIDPSKILCSSLDVLGLEPGNLFDDNCLSKRKKSLVYGVVGFFRENFVDRTRGRFLHREIETIDLDYSEALDVEEDSQWRTIQRLARS